MVFRKKLKDGNFNVNRINLLDKLNTNLNNYKEKLNENKTEKLITN